MTTSSSTIRHRATGTYPGYVWNPGTSNNGISHSRASLTAPINQLTYTLRFRPEDISADSSVMGWTNAFTLLRLMATKRLRINGYGSPNGSCGDAQSNVIPGNVVNTDIWVRARVDYATAVCSYWYSFEDLRDPAQVTWISLGTPTGSNPGTTQQLPGNSSTLRYGNVSLANNTGNFRGRIYYAAEAINDVQIYAMDWQEAAIVPAAHTVHQSGSPTARLQPERDMSQTQDLWIGNRRRWPLGNGYMDFYGEGGGGYGPAFIVDQQLGTELNVFDDLDVRWFGTLTQWNLGRTQALISRWDVFNNGRSWLLEVGATGSVYVWLSSNGTGQTQSAQIPVPFANGQMGGIRFTRVKTTGLTTIWFSPDGVVWTPQPQTSNIGVGLSLFNTTERLSIGGYNVGLGAHPLGRTAWVELRNGINGPVVFRFGSKSFRGVGPSQPYYTAETGQAMSRVDMCRLYPTVTTEDDVDLYKGDTRVWPGADGHASFYGTADNQLLVPHRTALSVGNRGSCWVVVRPHKTWYDVRSMTGKWGATGQCSWQFNVSINNSLQFAWSKDGTNSNYAWEEMLKPLTLPLGEWAHVGVSWDIKGTIADKSVITFWGAPYGRPPIKLDVLKSNVITDFFAGTNPLTIGVAGGWSDSDIRSVVLQQDASPGEPAYLQSSIATISTPDPGPIPAELTMIYHGRIGTGGFIAAQWPDLYTNAGFTWVQNTNDGAHGWETSPDGTNTAALRRFSPAGRPPSDTPEWHALAVQPNNAGQQILRGYYSLDGVNWVDCGANTASGITPFDSNGPVRIGAIWGGSYPHGGRLYSVEMRTGLSPTGGSTIWKFDASDYTSGTSYTDPRGRVWTMTAAGGILPATAPSGAVTQVFNLDRNGFKVGRRAATLTSKQADVITVQRTGATPTMLYPTVSEMLAKWDAFQWDDGSKWV